MQPDESLGYRVPRILLPRAGVDLSHWAVIACDQFTSEPDYWGEVERIVGEAPSTYHLILPEVYLGDPSESARIAKAQATMRDYLAQSMFAVHDGFAYVERTVAGRTRKGLVLEVDLEHYDFQKGSQSLIRPTEGTIVERLPPRMRLREGAALETPHILLLVDDPERTVIEPIAARKHELQPLYDFELMLGGGHLTGYSLAGDAPLSKSTRRALDRLAEPSAFRKKYGAPPGTGVILFAAGDGNHSLATAKAVWEAKKSRLGLDHPARYALVEVENVHDEGLVFEPIHRVVFDWKTEPLETLRRACGGSVRYTPCDSEESMLHAIELGGGSPQIAGLVRTGGCGVLTFEAPTSGLAVGTLDRALDSVLRSGDAAKVDYVHGSEVVLRLGREPKHAGLVLPPMQKSDLFRTVIRDGVLPRKTFSMGHAREKRFYLECRAIG